MLYPKAFYFFYYAAMAALLPFLVLHYEALGLSARQIGFLTGAMPLTMLLSAPLWGEWADATGRHRRLLLLAVAGTLPPVLFLVHGERFILLLGLVVVFAVAVAPVMPLVDNAVLDALGDKKSDYGKQRLWGAVGWGLSAPLAGWLTQRLGLEWAFYGYLVLMAGGLFVALRLPVGSGRTVRGFGFGLRSLLSDWPWLVFLTASFISGMSLAVSGNFLYLYLHELGGSRTLIGLSLSFATLSELPVMFFGARLLERLGARGLLVVSLLIFSLRLFAYSFMASPELALPIQLLHGPTFAAMWIAGVSYAKEIAPREGGAAAQGLFSGVTAGLGGAVGALAGGFLYDGVGPAMMFRVFGVAVLLGALLLLLGRRARAEARA